MVLAPQLFEAGRLGGSTPDGVLNVPTTKPISEFKLPPTVQAILASRIDRLPPATKKLLQTLAVIGREFTQWLISAVVPQSDGELSHMLNELQLGVDRASQASA